MARIAVIADIHGNLEAFEAVLGDIEKQKNIVLLQD
jgi:predicted phosphodiesterase